MDENGNPVDWYMGYKFPKLDSQDLFNTGHAYSYISSETVKDPINGDIQFAKDVEDTDSLIFLRRFKDLLAKFNGPFTLKSQSKPKARITRNMSRVQRAPTDTKWTVSNKLITDPTSAIMRTLAPAYDSANYNKISSVFYNDDPENTHVDSDSEDEEDDSDSNQGTKKKKGFSRTFAHAKGVLLLDEESKTGLWLTHSVPKFPNIRTVKLEYPESGGINGQTFMCVTFNLDESATKIIKHLSNMRPIVYDRQITPEIAQRFPELGGLRLYEHSVGKRVTDRTQLAQTIKTKDGQLLNLYSKPASIKEDIYNGWIDEDIGSDLYVQTWRRGAGGILNSSCPTNTYHVNNVKDLKYMNSFKDGDYLSWSYTNDHSKWLISDKQDFATSCICDANRVESQFKRGSGCVCMKCPTCWTVMKNTIADTEPCPVSSSPKSSRKLKTLDNSVLTKIRQYLDAMNIFEL
jgi:deoxyribonuclease-2